MESSQKPRLDLAQHVLPKPLLEAIQHIFKQHISGCALVGGTALAGFFAGHRRSDDLDLFVKGAIEFRATVLAVKSLSTLGASLKDEVQSAQYFHANCIHRKHHFTVDIVLDENLFRIGSFDTLPGGVSIADLSTLLKMKAATLVSRCGEKDLFDVHWLMGNVPGINAGNLIELGREVDTGVNAENMLASIAGATLRESACNFSTDQKMGAHEVFKLIKQFQKTLTSSLIQFLKDQPAPPIAKLTKQLKKGMD